MNDTDAPRRDASQTSSGPASPSGLDQDDVFTLTHTLITTRHHVSAKRLVDPGPDARQLHKLFELAAAAPDHGQLTPWRFILVPADKRIKLAEAFAQALIDRDPAATPEQVEDARAKAYRAPVLMIAVACLGPRDPDIPAMERVLSMGAAVQNILLGAHAMGFGGGLTSGRAMNSPRLHALLQLGADDVPVCCVNIGTVSKRKPAPPRPESGHFLRQF